MYIPKTILGSSMVLSQDFKTMHQSFAKKYLKLSKANKPQITNDKNANSLSDIQSVQLQNDIFNWFFSLDLPTRLKVSVIHNKFTTKILSQLLMLFYYDNNVTFQLVNHSFSDNLFNISSDGTQESQDFNDDDDIDFFARYYRAIESQIYLSKDNILLKEKDKEKDFIKMIQYISLKDRNDAIILKKSFLVQQDKFQYYFMNFSNKKVFTSWISLSFEEDIKMYNFTQTKWINKTERYSIASILVSYFEHNILLNYQYYYYTKQIYNFPYHQDITELIESIAKLESFLKDENIDSIFESINLDNIVLKIKCDQEISNAMKSQKKMNNRLFYVYFKSSCYLGEKVINFDIENIITKIRGTIDKSIENFVEMITCVDPPSIFNFNVFIYKEVFSYIHKLYINKNLLDLLKDDSSNSVGTVAKGKKKQNKKKKKKTKNKDKDNDQEIEQDKNKDMVNEKGSNETSQIVISNEKLPTFNENKSIFSIKDMNIAPISNNNIIIEDIKSIPEDIASNDQSLQENTLNIAKRDDSEKSNIDKDNNGLGNENETHSMDEDDTCSKKKKNEKQKKDSYLYPNLSKKKPKTKIDCCSSNLNLNISNKEIISNVSSTANQISIVESNQLEFHSNSQLKSKASSEDGNDPETSQISQFKQTNITQNLEKKETSSFQFHPKTTHNIIQTNPRYNQIQSNKFMNYPHYHPKPSWLYTYQTLQKYPYHPSEAFLSFLSQEISSFTLSVDDNISLLKPYKDKYLSKIEELIKSALDSKYIFKLMYFGSYMSKLSLENSDIDVLLLYKSKSKEHIPIEVIINYLVLSLNSNKNMFDYITPVYTASIPVIKLQCDFNKEIDNEIKTAMESKYLFNKNELIKVKFDLSFMEDNDTTLSIPSQSVLEYIKNSVKAYPDIKPLITVIKRYMQKEGLNSSFKGGLSSFTLFLMILSYLKEFLKGSFNESKSLGYTLLDIFEFYGTFDYTKYIIDSKENCPFLVQINDGITSHIITVLDPITKLNVAKSSFRIEEIKNAFIKGSNYLKQCSYNINIYGHKAILENLFTSS